MATEDGQFDDAPGTPEMIDGRAGHSYIDAEQYDSEEWPLTDTPDDGDDVEENYVENRPEDEDWEIAERDFTKQYNRLRQHVAVRTGTAQGKASSLDQKTSVAVLPAVNRPHHKAVEPSHLRPKDKTADQLAALSKYSYRIAKINVPYSMGIGVNKKGPSAHANAKDKADRATTEQVLDPRTRIILFKMIGRGLIYEINGCVSTGKEANVYHALTPDRSHLALKIYKTSILIFKDRDKYVTGEYRFRRGYSRNPRKMVRLWAEKEMRNLKRLVFAGVDCPEPVEVRENILVMKFIGDKEGWASPRLKDAELPASECARLYTDLVLIVRKIFHQCKLVHADLSEYNILYHEGRLCIIDVSQSVEHDHPSAFDFLRSDIRNVEDFFGKLGVKCLGLRRCFEFVTKAWDATGNFQDDQDREALRKLLEDDGSNERDRPGISSAHEDSVFLRSFIPRTLNEVYDPERDVDKFNRGEGRDLIYANTIGLVMSEPLKNGEEAEKFCRASSVNIGGQEGTPPSESDEDDESSESDREESSPERKPRGHRHEDRESKKERKKAVRAEARERRKNKMPKAEKKRIVKKSKH